MLRARMLPILALSLQQQRKGTIKEMSINIKLFKQTMVVMYKEMLNNCYKVYAYA